MKTRETGRDYRSPRRQVQFKRMHTLARYQCINWCSRLCLRCSAWKNRIVVWLIFLQAVPCRCFRAWICCICWCGHSKAVWQTRRQKVPAPRISPLLYYLYESYLLIDCVVYIGLAFAKNSFGNFLWGCCYYEKQLFIFEINLYNLYKYRVLNFFIKRFNVIIFLQDIED